MRSGLNPLSLQIYPTVKIAIYMEKDYLLKSRAFREEAERVLRSSGMIEIWSSAGCRVNIVGSMRMDLMARHRDIDLHVYSSSITEESSFAIGARMARNPAVKEIRCINGLHTDERCMAWHVTYDAGDGVCWQFDIIHIEEGSGFDGFFERMADRIVAVATPEQRETILRLKFETPEGEEIHGVEYYEAVISCGITTMDALRDWLPGRRSGKFYYWMP